MHPSTPPTSPARSHKLNKMEKDTNSHSIPTGQIKKASMNESMSDPDEQSLELCGDKSEKSSGSSTITQGDRISLPSVAIVVSIEDDSGETRVVDLEEENLETENYGRCSIRYNDWFRKQR